MYYTIYKITNMINGKIYIGKHQTNNLNDGYFGSGIALVKAIKKYGKESFKKEILYVFNNALDMDNKEKEIITEEFVLRRDTYNLGVGGEGGPHFKGRRHTPETKKKLSSLNINRKPLSQEARQKISEANKRRVVTEETKKKIAFKAYMRHGKTLEEATWLWLHTKEKVHAGKFTPEENKRRKSQAQKQYMSDIKNRLKLSLKLQKLYLKFDFESIKTDLEIGLKPKEIRIKYNMSKNTYDHMIPKYIKPMLNKDD